MSDHTYHEERGQNKRVRISEAAPSVKTFDDRLSDQERSDSWWTAKDYAAVKDSVKRQCRKYRRSRRYSDCLTDAYQTACCLACDEEDEKFFSKNRTFRTASDLSLKHTGTSEKVSLSPLPQTPDQGLVRWVKDQGPRGLEGYSSRLHAMRRHRHLQNTKHAVFLEQARQNISKQRDDELLARQAESASRRARTFAALLGHADAWAVTLDEGYTEARRL